MTRKIISKKNLLLTGFFGLFILFLREDKANCLFASVIGAYDNAFALICCVRIFKNFAMGETIDLGDDCLETTPPVEFKTTETKVSNFGDDSDNDIVKSQFGDIHPNKRLKFAKSILIFAVGLFIILVATMIYYKGEEGVMKAWNFGSVAINSIVMIIIGYYFASRND